jgi:hypothetical protein
MRRGGAVAPRPEGKNTRDNSALLVHARQGTIGTAAPTIESAENARSAQNYNEYEDFRRGKVAEKRLGVSEMTNPMKKAGKKTRRTSRKTKKVSRRR